MYRIIHGSTHGLADVEAFIETLNTLDEHPMAAVRSLFDTDADLIVARAPGRLDVMGGIADYSGSLVLQLPVREGTLVALQRDTSRALKIVNLGADRAAVFEMPLSDLEVHDRPVEYEAACAYFGRDPERRWAAYVAGAFLVLMRERDIQFHDGARLLIASQVPEGKGVSSSAAIEVAVMQAVTTAFGVPITPRELALLCQKVENLVVGAPCGVMDQMTAACGEANRLLALLCQPAEIEGLISIPEELAVWGLDSGVPHSVTGADYTSVRIGAFMGYRIICELRMADGGWSEQGAGSLAHGVLCSALHAPDSTLLNPQSTIHNPQFWGGYLANLTPAEFEECYSARLPERMTGEEFLARYKGTTDPVTRVTPERTYAVRTPTAHPIYEHARVRAYTGLLGSSLTERQLQLLGELMYESHASYSACGLGSAGTDRLVELVRAGGPSRGLYGAKITGGGSGGTVAVVGRRGAEAAIQAIADEYARETGYRPYIFTGSSPGASAFGHVRLSTHG